MMAMILIKTYKKKKESKANYIKFQDKKVNKMVRQFGVVDLVR